MQWILNAVLNQIWWLLLEYKPLLSVICLEGRKGQVQYRVYFTVQRTVDRNANSESMVIIGGWLHVSFPLFLLYPVLFCVKGFSQDKLSCFSVCLGGPQGVAPYFFFFPEALLPHEYAFCAPERHTTEVDSLRGKENTHLYLQGGKNRGVTWHLFIAKTLWLHPQVKPLHLQPEITNSVVSEKIALSSSFMYVSAINLDLHRIYIRLRQHV